jgi:hypothetical protein
MSVVMVKKNPKKVISFFIFLLNYRKNTKNSLLFNSFDNSNRKNTIKSPKIKYIFRKYIKPDSFSINDYIYYDVTKYTKFYPYNKIDSFTKITKDEKKI